MNLDSEHSSFALAKKNGHDVDQWPGRSEELIPTVRKAVGDNIELMVDANSCYSPPKAIALGRLLEDYNYSFFEEPCPYWELEWTAEVASNISVPVAGGEQDTDLSQWRRMIRMNAVDIVQPDVCYIGGLTRAYRVARMAERAGKLIIPHTSNWSMVSIFSLHLLGAFSNRKYLEYTIDGTTELANTSSEMYSPQLKVVNGNVKIPDGPGWGVDISPKWLENATYRKSEIS